MNNKLTVDLHRRVKNQRSFFILIFRADRIVKAINQIQVVNMTAARSDPSNSKDSFSDERIKKYVQILQKADPTLREMNISFEEEMGRQKFNIDDFENREIIAMKTTVGIETRHFFVSTLIFYVPFYAFHLNHTLKFFISFCFLF